MASSSSDYLDHIPAAAAPDGQTSNLVDPPNKAHILTIVDAVFVSLMLVAVSVRFFVRLRLTKNWGWDDAACFIAVLGSLSHTILYSQMVEVGFGRHLWDIPASWLVSKSNVQLLSANGITYPITVFFAKLSILLLYLRIFSVNRTLRTVIHGTVLIMALFYLSMIGLGAGSIAECTGVESATKNFCMTYSGPIILVNGSFGAITDLFILCMPFPLLSKLQLRPKKKLGLGVVFATGLIACAASLARVISFAINYKSSDVFWVQATTSIFTTVEINVGIIVGCVFCFSLFYARSKAFLTSATTTIRQRLSPSKGSSKGSTKGTDREKTPLTSNGRSAIILTRPETQSNEADLPWFELGGNLAPQAPQPVLQPRTELKVWS